MKKGHYAKKERHTYQAIAREEGTDRHTGRIRE
jgi:hypothetical protein